MAAELVQRRVNVLAAPGGGGAPLAAKAATATIPIVFETGADPVAVGLVGSLSRPTGNVTGVTSLNLEVGPKRFELLRQLLPTANAVAMLVNPNNPNSKQSSRNRARRPARSTLSSISCRPAATAISKESLRSSPSCARLAWWSRPIRCSSSAEAVGLLH